MAITLDQIVEETRQLPPDVVAELVDRILEARHGGIAAGIGQAWSDEIHRRIADLETGTVEGVPLEKSLERARKILGK